MTSSISEAEKNLARSQGRTLNATQSDLATKIKQFIGDAQAASREGDWTRARSLATKAQVLSEELASSL
jgi:outer membrane murein-binding lipoprotein Lpp